MDTPWITLHNSQTLSEALKGEQSRLGFRFCLSDAAKDTQNNIKQDGKNVGWIQIQSNITLCHTSGKCRNSHILLLMDDDLLLKIPAFRNDLIRMSREMNYCLEFTTRMNVKKLTEQLKAYSEIGWVPKNKQSSNPTLESLVPQTIEFVYCTKCHSHD